MILTLYRRYHQTAFPSPRRSRFTVATRRRGGLAGHHAAWPYEQSPRDRAEVSHTWDVARAHFDTVYIMSAEDAKRARHQDYAAVDA